MPSPPAGWTNDRRHRAPPKPAGDRVAGSRSAGSGLRRPAVGIQRSASGCCASTWTRGTTSPAGSAIIEGLVERLAAGSVWAGLVPARREVRPRLVAAAFARRGSPSRSSTSPGGDPPCPRDHGGTPLLVRRVRRATSRWTRAFDAAVTSTQPQVPRPDVSTVPCAGSAGAPPGAPIAVEIYLATPYLTAPSTSWSTGGTTVRPGRAPGPLRHAMTRPCPRCGPSPRPRPRHGTAPGVRRDERLLQPTSSQRTGRAGFPPPSCTRVGMPGLRRRRGLARRDRR